MPTRHVRARLATLVVVATAGTALSPVPAVAAPRCRPVAYTASADAALARLSVLTLRPLGIPLPALADVALAPTESRLDSTSDTATRATARYVQARALGMPVPDTMLTTASQSAPPEPAGPPTAFTVASASVPTLSAGVGTLRAVAHWRPADTCPTGPRALTAASTSMVDATVLPGTVRHTADGGADPSGVLRLRDELSTSTATSLVRLDDRHLGVRSEAAANGVRLSLFAGTPQQISVGVLSAPTLTAVAGGVPGTSTVDWQPPVVELTLPGHVERLDSPDKVVEIGVAPGDGSGTGSAPRTLTGDPLSAIAAHAPAREHGPAAIHGHLLSIRLSLGHLDKDVTDTAVHASASILRLEVRAGHSTLLDLGIGTLTADAGAPAGGIAAATPPTGTPSQVAAYGGPATLPVTGTRLAVASGLGSALLAGGVLLLATARRRRFAGAHRARAVSPRRR